MLDNFYIVKQTFRQIKEDLPASFLNQLPRLKGTAPDCRDPTAHFCADMGMDWIQPESA